ncbi:lysine 5,6-aminomutase reactivase ATPase KamC [Guggenheimella bovis]
MENIGFDYILQCTNTMTPFGDDYKKKLPIYTRKDALSLQAEWESTEYFYKHFEAEDQNLESIGFEFCQMKNIRRSIERIPSEVLDEVEFFELKLYLYLYEKIHSKLKGYLDLPKDLSFYDFSDLRELLDPQHSNLLTFSVYSEYSEKLRELRRKKQELEKTIRQQGMIDSIMNERRLVVEDIQKEEYLIRLSLTETIAKKREVLLDSMDKMALLDFRMAKAKLALSFHAIKPVLTEGDLAFKGMRHPYYERIFEKNGHSMQPIDMSLTKGVTVLTGANMGGKSVTLKTLLLQAELVRRGFFVFAESAKVCLFDFIDYLHEDGEDIHRGLSSFGSEVKKLEEILEHEKSGMGLIVMDEPARGTNPTEGRAILRAINEHLKDSSSILIMASHLPEIISEGMKHLQIRGLRSDALQDLSHVSRLDAVRQIERVMDYTIEAVDIHTPVPHQAVKLMEKMGFNQEVIQEIHKILGE